MKVACSSLLLMCSLSCIGDALRWSTSLSEPFASSRFRLAAGVKELETIPSLASSVPPLEVSLNEFHATLAVNPFDAMKAARIHLDLVVQLVRSDVQNRDDDEDSGETHIFPPSYWTALSFITDTINLLKENDHPLHSSANMIAKKEGLPQVARTIRTAVVSRRLMNAREIVEVKRKVERVLSQLMTLSIGYRR